MGYSPLSGLTMGTRSGDIDGNAVLALAARHGVGGAARLLNREGGLLALGGHSDMRALRAAGTDAARFAIAHFRHWAVRHAGAMIAAMGGIDALAFTGGIGENSAYVRAHALEGLELLGVGVDGVRNVAPSRAARRISPDDAPVRVLVVPTNEEMEIGLQTLAVARG